MISMNDKVLIVAAHPDDEAIGCAGTIKKLTEQNKSVYLLIATDGESAREDGADNIKKRNSSLVESSEILGIKDIFNLNLPDNEMDTVPLLSIVKNIENIILKIKPSVIYTHHHGDLNIDHAILNRATITACRPIPESTVRDIIAYEVLSSTEWNINNYFPFLPNYFNDITDYIDVKRNVLQIYNQEMRKSPHSRSIDNIINHAKVRGSSVGLEYAEAFVYLRKLS